MFREVRGYRRAPAERPPPRERARARAIKCTENRTCVCLSLVGSFPRRGMSASRLPATNRRYLFNISCSTRHSARVARYAQIGTSSGRYHTRASNNTVIRSRNCSRSPPCESGLPRAESRIIYQTSSVCLSSSSSSFPLFLSLSCSVSLLSFIVFVWV